MADVFLVALSALNVDQSFYRADRTIVEIGLKIGFSTGKAKRICLFLYRFCDNCRSNATITLSHRPVLLASCLCDSDAFHLSD